MSELDKMIEVRAKEKSEFEDAFEEVLGKTDEEIEASVKKAKEDEEAAKAGDATGEQSTKPSDDSYAFNKDQQETDPVPAKPANDNQGTDWQTKYEELDKELTKEKQRTASWDGRIKAANEKSKKLEDQVAILLKEREEKQATKTAEQDMSDKEKMDLFRENFPELADFADILERKLDGIKAPAPVKDPTPEPDPAEADKDPKAGDDVKPSGPSPHYVKITDTHPELDEIVASGKLLSWINTQPDYIRPHLSKVYNRGTADEVISVITEFKSKTGWKSDVVATNPKQDKLNSMLEAGGESPGPKADGPDKQDFAGTAKEIGL